MPLSLRFEGDVVVAVLAIETSVGTSWVVTLRLSEDRCGSSATVVRLRGAG